MKSLGTFTRTEFCEKILWLDGKPLSLKDYPFFRAVYNTDSREVVLKTARQCTKSTASANIMIADSIRTPHFRTLYISPSKEQTSKFSNTRLTKIIHYSPIIRKAYIDPGSTNNVLLQIFKNGSEMALSYAGDDPDRVRGISADREFIDEVQDILYDTTIPVVKECMANSDYGYLMYTGTPKSMENTIELLWQRSTQSEWIIACSGCAKHQVINTVKSIGKHGIICLNCGKALNPREGQWYDFNPNAKVKGYHISQPILPRNNENPARWERILEKLETYGETQFKNEVLGVSDAVGARLLSQDDLFTLCQDYVVDMPISAELYGSVKAVVAGVDWGGGGSELKSRTVVWVWGLTENYHLKTLFFKVLPSNNAAHDVDEVADILTKCNCRFVVGDAGGGAVANASLRDKLGPHRVGQAQYGGGVGFNALIKWSAKSSRYLVNRTAAIDSFMLRLKNREIIFPNLRQMATPIQDVLAEYEEMIASTSDTGGRKVWRHSPTAPDDCLHAMIFGWLAMKVVQGDITMYEQSPDYAEGPPA